jgi:hypothetical protein
MSSAATTPVKQDKPKKRKKRQANREVNGGSRVARQLSAVILEVLAGMRTPTDAAEAVGISVARYYLLETRALQGLVEACEPRKTGKRRSPEKTIAGLKTEIARLKREYERTQALLRLSHRTLGVSAPKAEKPKAGGKRKRRRKPKARALKAAAMLREGSTEENADAKEATPQQLPARPEGGRDETRQAAEAR